MRARGRHTPGVMNRLEAAFAQHLEFQRTHGEIVSWKFEKVRLVLAPGTTYTPDFHTVQRNGEITFFECKGFMRDDAAVKLKCAAEMFPEYRFVLVRQIPKRDGGGWDETEIKAGTQVIPPARTRT